MPLTFHFPNLLMKHTKNSWCCIADTKTDKIPWRVRMEILMPHTMCSIHTVASESKFPIVFVIEFIHRSFIGQLVFSKAHKKCPTGLGSKSFTLKALLDTVTNSLFYCVAVSPFAGAFEYFIACCLPLLFWKAWKPYKLQSHNFPRLIGFWNLDNDNLVGGFTNQFCFHLLGLGYILHSSLCKEMPMVKQ